MTAVTVYVPRDASALSIGAGDVAEAIAKEASARGIELKLVRNGSRGAFWLEPLVEVVVPNGAPSAQPAGQSQSQPSAAGQSQQPTGAAQPAGQALSQQP